MQVAPIKPLIPLFASLLLDDMDHLGDSAAIGFRRQMFPAGERAQLDRLGFDKLPWLDCGYTCLAIIERGAGTLVYPPHFRPTNQETLVSDS